MKGRILSYSVQTNSGEISGDDGNRYTFAGQEWKESQPPARGMYVDFTATESEATSIYLAPGGTPGIGTDRLPPVRKARRQPAFSPSYWEDWGYTSSTWGTPESVSCTFSSSFFAESLR